MVTTIKWKLSGITAYRDKGSFFGRDTYDKDDTICRAMAGPPLNPKP